MKTGKISESILKRSVLRRIKGHRKEVIKGAEAGEDCALLSWENAPGDIVEESMSSPGRTAVSTQTVTLPVKNAAYLAVMAAANNLAAAGAFPTAVMLAVTLPETSGEEILKEIMQQAEACSRELNMEIAGGHTEVSDALRWPIITATVLGITGAKMPGAGRNKAAPEGRKAALEGNKAAPEGRKAAPEGSRAAPEGNKAAPGRDLDLVVSKWIAMEGASVIAREKEAELLKRYPAGLIQLAGEQGDHLSVAPEAAIALKSGVYAMHDMRNGGIFGALWEISRKLGVGFCVDLQKIPIRQETIEICEFYNLNPYELLSGGALIMAAEDGPKLMGQLDKEGIAAAVIGRTNHGNDKVIVNGDEIRYLGMPVQDEIHKISFI